MRMFVVGVICALFGLTLGVFTTRSSPAVSKREAQTTCLASPLELLENTAAGIRKDLRAETHSCRELIESQGINAHQFNLVALTMGAYDSTFHDRFETLGTLMDANLADIQAGRGCTSEH